MAKLNIYAALLLLALMSLLFIIYIYIYNHVNEPTRIITCHPIRKYKSRGFLIKLMPHHHILARATIHMHVNSNLRRTSKKIVMNREKIGTGTKGSLVMVVLYVEKVNEDPTYNF